jgi:hypothetical protein
MEVLVRMPGSAARFTNELKRVLAGAAAIYLNQVAAHAQTVELAEVRLLTGADAPAQTAVFELINESHETISYLAVSCQLLNETDKTVAVKAVRFRNIPPGSSIGDATFPVHVRGTAVACRILHQRLE